MTILLLIILISNAEGKTSTQEITARFINMPQQDIKFDDRDPLPAFPILEQSYEELLGSVLDGFSSCRLFEDDDSL